MNVEIQWSNDDTELHEFTNANTANEVFARFQYEVDHPAESKAIRGDLVPTRITLIGN